jgi:predicted enzyme related to lactoylglutathione lyase
MSQSNKRYHGAAIVALLAVATAMPPAATAAVDPPPAPNGSVAWWDLLTEDADAVFEFYTTIFGWEFKPFKPGAWVVVHGGRPIGGISEIDNQLPENESFWLAGIAVYDVDAAMARAKELGATVHIPVKEIADFARYGVISDPQGAELLLVKPLASFGLTKGHGAFVWTEHWAKDVEAAIDFYGKVIGYELGEVDVSGKPYQVFKRDDQPRAGVLKTPYENVEPTWAPYIGVGKFTRVLELVVELGGQIILRPAPEFGGGRVALVADPGGGAFFILDLEAGR